MNKISYTEYCKYNIHYKTYGRWSYKKTISKKVIRSMVVLAGVVVPVILPIPLMFALSKFVKSDFEIRF